MFERGGVVGDTGAPGPPGAKAEPRWPMATAVLVATIPYVPRPPRRVPGWWLFPLVQLVLLGLLITQDPGRIDRRSPTLQRLMVVLLLVMTAGTILGVVVLAHDILVAVEGVTATVLLGRGATIWIANVIVFSLWYWEFDRGPGRAGRRLAGRAELRLPRERHPRAGAGGWRPAYPDYLYLAFTNATASSPPTPSWSGGGPS